MSHLSTRNYCVGKAPTTHTATNSSSVLMATNASRRGAMIQVTGNKAVFLGFGSNAAEVNKGVRLVKNERLVMDATLLPTEAVNVITASGTSTVLIQEWD